MRTANVPPPPKMKSVPGSSGDGPCRVTEATMSRARSSSRDRPDACSDEATLAYSANPSTIRTRSVVPPLQATRRHRTDLISRASESVAPASGASGARSGIVAGSPIRAIREPVANAPDRLDPPTGRPELRPEIVDIRVHGVEGDRDRERPRLVDELVASQR